MQQLDKVSLYTLPENVEVVRFDIFQPYNRINVLTKNKALIVKSFISEILKSSDRLKYIIHFKSSINDLLHKIATANLFASFLKENNQQIDIAYTYWFNQWTFILSFFHKKHSDFKLFSRIHGSDVYEDQHLEKGFFFKFRTFQLKEITSVLAISQNGLKHFRKKNHVSANKILLSRLGTEDLGEGFYEKLPFNRIVSCSALQHYKRVNLIIDILSFVTHQVEWVHFGGGELKNEILEKSKLLPPNITFKFMGAQSNATIMNYYKNNVVDVFINVSSSEGIPVSIMEALSFGIPVIATNVGGVSEIVNNNTGYLIDSNFDILKTSQLLENFFLKTESEKLELRKNSRSFWQAHFNAESNYNNLFRQLVNA